MAKTGKFPVSRRDFIAGSSALTAGTLGFPLIGGAQAKTVKVGIIHPVTGFVAFAGSSRRLEILGSGVHEDRRARVKRCIGWVSNER